MNKEDIKIRATFDGNEKEFILSKDQKVFSLDFDGEYLIEIDENFELTGNAIDGYGSPINPLKYEFSINKI